MVIGDDRWSPWSPWKNGASAEASGGMTTRLTTSAERPVRPPPDPNVDPPLVCCLGLGLLLAAATGTQYVAWRFAFHPNLGAPLVVLGAASVRVLRAGCVLAAGGAVSCLLEPRLRRLVLPLVLVASVAGLASVGPLYAPYRIFLWHAANARLPAAAPVFREAWALVATMAIACSIAVTSVWRREQGGAPSTSHGSAHWGRGELLDREKGFLLGRVGARLLRVAGEGHVLTVAPTRSGKGVSAVIPNLLDHPGSVLVTDPKGENYAVTAHWRAKTIGQAIHAFDPFGVVGGEATYNPLDLIDAKSAEAVDDARMLADMLVLPLGREGEQAFWNEEARGLLTGLILYVAATLKPEHRDLAHVRQLLTLAPELFRNHLELMLASEAAGGLVARAAARLLQKADKERSGVVSTAQSHTHFLDSPRMATVLGPAKSSVDLSLLKQGRASVYLILPTDRLDGYARWLRLMIACALLAMARTRGQPKERVLFLLDEFAHLGRMHPVQRDIGLAGGFGVTFWLVVQDLAQLRSTYGETWPTFLSNVDVLQAFGVNDWDTADYLSKMTGEATISVESENRSRGVSRGLHAQRQLGAGRTRSEWGRRLLLPDEVRRLPQEVELLFVKGAAPLLVERLSYLRDLEFTGRAQPNPLYNPVAAVAG